MSLEFNLSYLNISINVFQNLLSLCLLLKILILMILFYCLTESTLGLSIAFQATLGNGNKPRIKKDHIHFLPALPPKYSKPAWQINPPSFILTDPKQTDASTTQKHKEFDIAAEMSASK